MDLALINRIAVRAAYRAGRILNERFGNITRVFKKGAIDLVTEADIASEETIIASLREVFPEHGIMAEESGLLNPESEFCWIIDPLDGTTNFAHNLPLYAVSIAFTSRRQPLLGLVFIPWSGELFVAQKDRGARLNDLPIRVSPTDRLDESLVVTGFPYNARERIGPLMSRFTKSVMATQGVRRLGSAAIDLCYVACGRFDAFWEEGLKPWDTAAGVLIVEEAGGRVTDFDQQNFHIDCQQLLASNGQVHTPMIKLLQEGDSDEA